jgi:hypothetical protein
VAGEDAVDPPLWRLHVDELGDRHDAEAAGGLVHLGDVFLLEVARLVAPLLPRCARVRQELGDGLLWL